MRSIFFISAAVLLLLLLGWAFDSTAQVPEESRRRTSKNASDLGAMTYKPVENAFETITGRKRTNNGFAWKYGYDVAIQNGDLIVRVSVNLIPAGGVTMRELDRVKPSWEEGIERIWSHRFSLKTGSGKQYPIIMDVVFRGPRFHHDVIVRPGSGRSDELNWNILDSPELVSHEFGHMIGMFDEYHKGALAPRGAIIDRASIMTSNPGEGAASHARHYEPFRRWFVSKTMMSNVRIIHEKGNHE